MPVRELLYFFDTGDEVFCKRSMIRTSYNEKETNASPHDRIQFILPVADTLIF